MVAAPAGAKVVASDFYRGKVKSIYEREPLFRDFAEVQQLWVDLDRGQNFRAIGFFNEADTFESRGLYHTTFYGRNLQIFVIS
jgi:hypothetical protein